ncbi:histidine kinase [Pleomorphomonas diazotrophica]|uniref:Blue-light-activated histidine kinase n=1 Tax=Pleomorphomonas diazotrophica TaxID=1166257 RepID=A0A1I4UKN7_9HYPH|nr:HWE histidine kinase domain-containing protein [Pleomorphomonas diazotrophica]PKR88387.1 histidine kinase [Pleomorphomonas diazotrophica]SFM89569.1 Two-component sensor histidine kinase, contains HisKA and HATPase domains [Pleomorphomonas diazotrophica]
MNMEELYRLLRAGHVQAQGIVDTVADPMLLLDESLRVQSASRAFFEVFKVERDDTIGRHIYELGNGQWDILDLRHLLLEVIPKSKAVIDFRVEHDFPDLGRKTMLLTARTLRQSDAASPFMLLSIVDITERAQHDAERDMLFSELKHRMKNLLSVAQSLARQTTTDGRSAAQYRDDFLGRFRAMIEAQEVGLSGDDGTNLKALIERVLSPYAMDPEAVEIVPDGPVSLASTTLTSLGLVLHELATNAAKYGALSVPEGRVSIGWTVDAPGGNLRLTWVESGGPRVTPPTTLGFGSKLIRTAIAGGEVDKIFAPDGVRVKIDVPLGPAPSAS